MLDELIQKLKSRLLQEKSLEVFCYYFINARHQEIKRINRDWFTGEVEQIAVLSFSKEYADKSQVEKVVKKLNNLIYRKTLTVYHVLGLSLQDSLRETQIFEEHLKESFVTQSIRYKYLITKVFRRFEDQLRRHLIAQVETQDSFTLILKHLYLELYINKTAILSDFSRRPQDLDTIDLILLEDLRDIQSIGYNKLHEKLSEDVLWCATEILSKHKVLNNNEDQYNSLFQSLLLAKGYRVQDQTQRGTSLNAKQYGELDVAVFSNDDIPLSILEAFIIDSIDTDYITKHLKKLSENYDPTGLKINYAIIYSKNRNFPAFWENYKNFVPTISFNFEVLTSQVDDISSRYPQFAGIRVGQTKYKNRGTVVKVFHVFIDMNLP